MIWGKNEKFDINHFNNLGAYGRVKKKAKKYKFNCFVLNKYQDIRI